LRQLASLPADVSVVAWKSIITRIEPAGEAYLNIMAKLCNIKPEKKRQQERRKREKEERKEPEGGVFCCLLGLRRIQPETCAGSDILSWHQLSCVASLSMKEAMAGNGSAMCGLTCSLSCGNLNGQCVSMKMSLLNQWQCLYLQQ